MAIKLHSVRCEYSALLKPGCTLQGLWILSSLFSFAAQHAAVLTRSSYSIQLDLIISKIFPNLNDSTISCVCPSLPAVQGVPHIHHCTGAPDSTPGMKHKQEQGSTRTEQPLERSKQSLPQKQELHPSSSRWPAGGSWRSLGRRCSAHPSCWWSCPCQRSWSLPPAPAGNNDSSVQLQGAWRAATPTAAPNPACW